MTPDLRHVRAARIPAESLAALADLRREVGILVSVSEGVAWVRWDGESEPIVRRLLPVPRAELFERRDGSWHRLGARLPTQGPPPDFEGSALPLHRAVVPRPLAPEPPGGGSAVAARLALARDDRPRPPSALLCVLADLGKWAEMAPSPRIVGLAAARAGDELLVLGRKLPDVPGTRFWGGRLLTPLGFRPDPELAEEALRKALGAAEDELVLLDGSSAELLPRRAFRPLTRAGVRLALEERPA